MDALLADLRHALRRLRRAPTFAVTAVLILGIGIGMATAMFTIFHAVVLRKLPVRDPDRILVLWTLRDPTVELPLDVNEVDELRRESRTLKDVAGFVHWGAQAVPLTQGDRPIVLKQAMVTAGFFDVLGARPVLGRLLQAEDGVEGAAPVAVISYEAWQRDFGGDPRVPPPAPDDYAGPAELRDRRCDAAWVGFPRRDGLLDRAPPLRPDRRRRPPGTERHPVVGAVGVPLHRAAA